MSKDIFIEQLQRGDQIALTRLVEDNQDNVYRTCLAYVQNEHDAADITQNVFINVLEKVGQFKGEATLSTWLIRIAINLSINFLRDNKKRLKQLDVTDLQMESDDNSDDSQKEAKRAVRNAIYSLPDKQKKVFVLHFYLKLSYKDIASVTNYSVSSIESLLFRARKKLRSLLQGYYQTVNS